MNVRLWSCAALSMLILSGVKRVGAANIVTLSGKTTAAMVAAACEQTASADQAGAVVLIGKVKDKDCNVQIGVPCAVQLSGKASIQLKRCRIASRMLNISDSASAPGRNAITIKDSEVVGADAAAGLLVSLTDPRDVIVIGNSSISYDAGAVIKATGSRIAPPHGGTISIKDVSLMAGGIGVMVAASTRKGSVVVRNSELNASTVVLVADRCLQKTGKLKQSCKANAIAEDLARQLATAP